MGILLLNARGINTRDGAVIIRNQLVDLGIVEPGSKTIFAVSCPGYEVDEYIIENLMEIIGFKRENIYMSADGIPKTVIPDMVYVTEGNTFEVLNYMRINGLTEYIRSLFDVNDDIIYIGSSAGAMIAGTDIMLARDFDSNDVHMIDFTGLELFEGTVIPHYNPEQLELYLSYTEEHIKNRYSKILSVGNEEVIVERA